MRCCTLDEYVALEALVQDFIEQQQALRSLSVKDEIGQSEVLLVIKYVQALDNLGVCEVALRKTAHLVEQ